MTGRVIDLDKPTIDSIERFLDSVRELGNWFDCFDCLRPCGAFNVHDHVWHAAVPGVYLIKQEIHSRALARAMPSYLALLRKSGREKGAPFILCVRCLERRHGAPLEMKDFTDAPVNDVLRFGYLIRKRADFAAGMGGKAEG
jgi:hypothetical protein